MRKEKVYFIGVLLVLMCLSGCGQSKEEKLRAAADQVMKNIQVCESNIMQKVYEETREKDSTEEANEDLYQYDSMANYILDSNKKLTYEITNVDVEGLKVSVSCHYLDSSEFVTNLVGKAFEYALSQAFSGSDSDISDEKMNELVQNSIDDVKEEKRKDKNVTLTFKEEEGQLSLAQFGEDLTDVATAGLHEAFNAIGNALSNDDESEDYSAYADQIQYDLVNTKSGAVVTFTNESDVEVDVHADLIFRNAEGGMIENTEKDIPCLAPGQKKKIGFDCSAGSFETADVQITASDPLYNDYSDSLTVESNDTEDGIIVKSTNQGDKQIDFVVVYIFCYQNGECVGFNSEVDYQSVAPGNYSSLTIWHPYDRVTYENIPYDDFETVVYGYSYK